MVKSFTKVNSVQVQYPAAMDVGGDSAEMTYTPGACSACGPKIQKLIQAIERMEIFLGKMGYPIEACDKDEPPTKKMKLDTSSSAAAAPASSSNAADSGCCNVKSLSDTLRKKIEVLESKWEIHFGDPVASSKAPESKVPPAAAGSISSKSSEKGKQAASSFSVSTFTEGPELEKLERDFELDDGAELNSFKPQGDYQRRCPMCPEMCENLEQASLHLRDVHGHLRKPMPCLFPPCEMLFVKWKDRRGHGKRVHKVYVSCSLCNKHFKRTNGLEEHLRAIHGLHECNTCPECSQYFGNHEEYLKHVFEHEEKTEKKILWSCGQCVRYFLSEKDQLNHESRAHTHECTNCGQKFISFKILQVHRKIQHNLEA